MKESELIDRIYGAVADPGRWPEVIVRISDHLGAVGGLLTYIAPQGRSLAVYARLSEEHAKINEQHYVLNPWSLAMRDFPFDRAVISNSLIEPGAILKTGLYADVLMPLGIENSLHTRYKALSRDGGFGGFAFVLSPRGSEQAEHALPRLQRLTPHLGRALDATMEVGRIAGGPRTLAAVLNVMPR